MSPRRQTALSIVVAAGVVAFAGAARPHAAAAREHPPQPQHGAVCTRQLVVPQTEGASGCWIDEHVTAHPGTLSMPCDGADGVAEAVFGDRHFTGSVSGGALRVVLHTQFHFSDGCDWGTAQTIDGNATSAHLAYGYREFPKPGQHGCASSCAASGDVRVR